LDAPASQDSAVDVSLRARASLVLASARLILLGSLTLVQWAGWIVAKTVARDESGRIAKALRWSHRWERSCLRALGIHCAVQAPLPSTPVLLTPNHLGYMDVLALGSVIPCFFVAKIDVERWPVIGAMFRTARQIGVPRSTSKGLLAANKAIQERLTLGHRVCVFLEGTSSGGDRLLPFYAPLVQPAIDADVPIVPVGITWEATRPGVDIAEDVAYWKDHVFAQHVWRLLGLRGIRVTVTFGEPIEPSDMDRRALATKTRRAVADLTGLGLDDAP
jgi:1-acyl-sn-glycerol-3-phosphate acyltransferase